MKAYTVNNHLVGVGNDQILGTDQGGGSKEYYAGQYISIDENDVISVTGLAPATAIPDTSDMATKTWVGEQGYLTSVPEGYATDQELAEAVSAVSSAIPTLPETEEVEFEELDLSDYALASAVPAAQVNSDWNANSGVAEILNKPTEIQLIAGTNVQVDVTGASAIISAQGGGGGSTYTAGDYIDISNDTISVTGLDNSNIFWAQLSGSSTTTHAAILAAYNAGKRILGIWNTNTLHLAYYTNNRFYFTGLFMDTTRPRISGNINVVVNSNNNIDDYAPSYLQADWNQTNSGYSSYILNKPDLSTYATQSYVQNYTIPVEVVASSAAATGTNILYVVTGS